MLLFLLVFFFGLFVVFAFQMRTRPVIDAAAVFLGDLRIHAGLALQLESAAGGDIDVEGFVEIDVALVEFVFGPELPGGERRVDHRDHVVFEHFAGAQAGNGDVLLAVVGVDGSFALDGSTEILHGVVAGLDDGAVFFQNADVGNLDALVGGVVALLQLSPLLHAGFALHADAGGRLFASGAVGLEAVVRVHLLDDEGLLRIVGLRGVGDLSGGATDRRLVGWLGLIHRGGVFAGSADCDGVWPDC